MGLLGAGRGPSDPEETEDVDEGDTRELVVSPKGRQGLPALEEAFAMDMEETKGPPAEVVHTAFRVAPKVREYVSRSATSEGTFPLLPGAYKLR